MTGQAKLSGWLANIFIFIMKAQERQGGMVKKELLLKVLLILTSILAVISLAIHNDIILLIAAVLMAICVVLSFIKRE